MEHLLILTNVKIGAVAMSDCTCDDQLWPDKAIKTFRTPKAILRICALGFVHAVYDDCENISTPSGPPPAVPVDEAIMHLLLQVHVPILRRLPLFCQAGCEVEEIRIP